MLSSKARTLYKKFQAIDQCNQEVFPEKMSKCNSLWSAKVLASSNRFVSKQDNLLGFQVYLRPSVKGVSLIRRLTVRATF